ncbi:hypothetical protein DPMN_131594 [Dreissena polymorpha]|uniref:Uncharacterized protein n=1 Tax=Dreissena polymorpha TaxID=45954 RepID=A0A9D4FUL7_DREPO|nr:hypothetical protein DPMN_131594 [Dreissena polymorpha]
MYLCSRRRPQNANNDAGVAALRPITIVHRFAAGFTIKTSLAPTTPQSCRPPPQQ